MEEILGLIVEFVLARPGAYVRWKTFGRKRTFNEVYEDDLFLNSFLGMVIIFIASGIIFFIVYFFN